jgi:hypothetical protein
MVAKEPSIEEYEKIKVLKNNVLKVNNYYIYVGFI